MNVSRTQIVNWLKRCLERGQAGDDCTLFVLFHVGGSRKLKNVDYWPVEGEFKIASAVDEIWDVAHLDCQGSTEINEYQLCAYFGESGSLSGPAPEKGAMVTGGGRLGAYGRRLKLVIHPSPDADDDEDASATESPTEKGVRATLMRQNETLFKSSVPWANQMMRMLFDQNAAKDLRIKELEEERAGMVRLQDELLSNKHSRDMELRKELFWEKKKEQAFEKAFPLLEVGVKQFLKKKFGKEIVKENPSLVIESIKSFLQGIKAEQFAKLGEIFGPEQMATLGSVVEFFMDNEEDENKKQKERMEEASRGPAVADVKPLDSITILEGTGGELLERERLEVRQKKEAEQKAAREGTSSSATSTEGPKKE